MKVSVSWLQEWIKEIPENLASRLTMAGLEVEAESLAAPQFTNVVVGEVVALSQHPDADRLQVAQVDIGEEENLQIVCGAPNVAVGMKSPTALVGATLPGDFKIKATKLRGVDSHGMLCSAKELGLSDDSSGLLALDDDLEVGRDFRELYQLDDPVFELDLTPNRGDCLSILGVARDIAAISGGEIESLEQQPQPVESDLQQKVSVTATEEAPRYLGRVIEGVDPKAPTPLWMSERLRRCGIRPHGILVDITNYILLELGQPLHAFDYDKIEGDITVRKATKGERITLINDETVAIKEGTLLIADDKKVLALAGIMGGASSACDDQTTNLFLESAWFDDILIAGKARDHGLHTDASHRYERGVDFNLAEVALERATELFISLAGGRAGAITRVEGALPERAPIKLRYDRVERLIGIPYAKERIVELLERLGTVAEVGEDSLTFIAPSYRFDLMIEADLIEEIVRLDGYENVPVNGTAKSILSMPNVPESEVTLSDFREILVARDYHEIISMSFVSPELQKILAPNKEPIALKNPISKERSVMRTTLITGLLEAMEHNLKRQQERLRFFESGATYNGTLENLVQERYFAGAICGDIVTAQWGEPSRPVDFFDLKGDVEALLDRTGLQYRFVVGEESILHPGQQADIYTESGERLGYLGKLHPSVAKALDLNRDIYLFELAFDHLKASKTPAFSELSRFPTSRRDLALVVPKEITTAQIIECMLADGKRPLLQSVNLFDLYEPKEGASEQSKNMAFTLIFQSREENLTDEEIDAIIESILDDLRAMEIQLRQ